METRLEGNKTVQSQTDKSSAPSCSALPVVAECTEFSPASIFRGQVLECFLSWIKYTNLQASDIAQSLGGFKEDFSGRTYVDVPTSMAWSGRKGPLLGPMDCLMVVEGLVLGHPAWGLVMPCSCSSRNPLIPECFKHVVSGGDLSETATDIIVELLRMLRLSRQQVLFIYSSNR